VCQQMSKIPHIHQTHWNDQKLSRSSNEWSARGRNSAKKFYMEELLKCTYFRNTQYI
jgi:hypothetical protein